MIEDAHNERLIAWAIARFYCARSVLQAARAADLLLSLRVPLDASTEADAREALREYRTSLEH